MPTHNTHQSLPVVVIGAGMAGLACAGALQAASRDVVVLEARQRIGGRIHSLMQGVDVFDLGASWIHGIEGNPIWQIVRSNHIRTVAFNYDTPDFYHNGKRLSQAEQACLEEAIAKIEAMISADDRAVSAQEALDNAMEHLAYTQCVISEEVLTKLVRAYFAYVANDPFATSLANLSAQYQHFEGYFAGDEHIFPQGYSQVIDVLSDGLVVKTGVEIQSVIREDGSVVLVDHQGQVHRASKVVVTVPLGVLRQQAMTFVPPLPGAHADAIARIGFGSFNKVFLALDAPLPFMQGKHANSVFYFHDGRWYNMLDLSGLYQRPVYLMLFGGEFSAFIDAASDEDVWHAIRDSLASTFADIPLHLREMHVTRWGADCHALGAFSFPLPGHTTDLAKTLQQPVDNRIYFAGEHCSPDYAGTVHGAYLSGMHTASILLNDLFL